MTIDEAIAHAREVAEKKYTEGMLCHANPDDGLLDECIDCAREHEQLAEWLKELKRYRNTESAYEQGGKDAVSEFVKALRNEFEIELNFEYSLNLNDINKIIDKVFKGIRR